MSFSNKFSRGHFLKIGDLASFRTASFSCAYKVAQRLFAHPVYKNMDDVDTSCTFAPVMDSRVKWFKLCIPAQLQWKFYCPEYSNALVQVVRIEEGYMTISKRFE